MDLVFEGTDEERRTKAEVIVQQIYKDLYGNGQPGLLGEMSDFMLQYRTIEGLQSERHKQNRWRLNTIIIVGVGILGAVATLIATYHK